MAQFRLLGLGLALLTVLVYGRACGDSFVNLDDGVYITENPQVQAGLNGRTFLWAWTTFHAGNWHPLTWLSLLLDTRLFGRSAWGYHLTNVLLHTANVVLLFAVLRRMTGALWRSALVAGLFAVHPLHVESVAWVTERKDVLSTLFLILTLGAYTHYTSRPSAGRYGLILLTFTLGLLAKPMLVTLPCVLLLLDYWPLRRLGPAATERPRSPWWLLAEKLPLFAMAVGVSAMTLLAQCQAEAVQSGETLSWQSRVATALVGYTTYLAKTFWPRDLAAFYTYKHYALISWEVIGSALLLTSVTALALWKVRRWPYLAVGWLWFLGTLVPVIGLVQVGAQALADRYTYVPHIGLFLALVWGGADLLERCRCPVIVRAGVAAMLLLALAAASWVQVGYWHDSETLWTHAVEVDPNNHRAHGLLGFVRFDQGNLKDARSHFATSVELNDGDWSVQYNLGVLLLMERQPQEAELHLKKALRYRRGAPGNIPVEYNLGVALLQQRRFKEAAKAFSQALQREPRKAEALDLLGQALFGQGERDQAVDCFRKALDIAPGNAQAHNGLGAVLLAQGHVEKARDHFRAALESKPQDPGLLSNFGIALGRAGDWRAAAECLATVVQMQPGAVALRCNLAFALHQAGLSTESAAHYREALRQDAGWPARLNEVAWRLATEGNPGLRDPVQAVELASQVCQATDNRKPAFLDTLAAAYAAAGRFADAVATARKGLDLAVTAQQKDVADQIREHLALYEKGQPLPIYRFANR